MTHGACESVAEPDTRGPKMETHFGDILREEAFSEGPACTVE